MNGMNSSSTLSLVHIAASCLALVIGAAVLVVRKGDRRHRRLGRVYAVAMILVNATAFCIYRLFGGFGPFHVAAIISLLTLLAGMRPVLMRPRPKEWATTHMVFMYWSVVGLYAAFASEVLVRVPARTGASFGLLVGLATGIIMVTAGLFQQPLLRRWSRELEH
jgi:uncharacterized membrane protein